MNNEKKLTFWKKLKYSIFDFEKYQELAAEKIGRTIAYIVLLMVIFNVVTASIYSYKVYGVINQAKQYISDNIETISFKENKLQVTGKNNETKIILEPKEELGATIIIDTNELENEERNKYIEEIQSEENGILILNDRIVLKNRIITSPYGYSYSDIAEQYNINFLDKEEVLNLLSGDMLKQIIVSTFIIFFIYLFIIYLSSVLVDAIMFFMLGYIVTVFAKIRIKYSAIYNIAIYALTLPIILNLIYFVVNSLTGFEIKYFQIMYIAVTSIYIIAAILLIKSDMIKKQIELTKILEEQERVREELKRKEEEEKLEAERERQRKEEERKRKQEEKEKQDEQPDKKDKKKRKKTEKPDINIGKEPEGNNV